MLAHEQIKKSAIICVDEHADLIQAIGNAIWQFAEVGKEEYRSAQYLCKTLEEHGYTVQRGAGGFPTGFIGEFKNGKGPLFGLLCEFDALPGLSSEKPGEPGHGCGHNLFAAGSMNVAIILRELMLRYNIQGSIKIFGSPAEEVYGAKPFYARQGLLDGVDAFFSFHPLDVNAVFYKKHNAIVSKKYRFYGTPAHAGVAPHEGRSALDAVEIMNVAVNYLREHVTPDVRIHYIITHGGDVVNVVPAFAESFYGIRAQELSNLSAVAARVDTIAKAAAMATECTVEIEFHSGLANTILTRRLAELAQKNLEFVGPPVFDAQDIRTAHMLGHPKAYNATITALPDYPSVLGGSTDEADVSWIGPWTRISCAAFAQETPWHTKGISEQGNLPAAYKAIRQSIKATVCTILDLFADPEYLARVKQEHSATMQGTEYPKDVGKYPEKKFFPTPLGVRNIDSMTIGINLRETVLLQDLGDVIISVYCDEIFLGSQGIRNDGNEHSIEITKPMDKGAILTLTYTLKERAVETLLGYLVKN